MAGGYREQWWGYNDVNCTKGELCKTLGNYLSTEALMIGKDNQHTIARKVRKILVTLNSYNLEKGQKEQKFCIALKGGL